MAKTIQEAMKQQAGAPEAASAPRTQVETKPTTPVAPQPEVKKEKEYNPHSRFVASCPMINLGD